MCITFHAIKLSNNNFVTVGIDSFTPLPSFLFTTALWHSHTSLFRGLFVCFFDKPLVLLMSHHLLARCKLSAAHTFQSLSDLSAPFWINAFAGT